MYPAPLSDLFLTPLDREIIETELLRPVKANPGKHKVGAHCSIAGGHDKALFLANDLGCELLQIFTKNNMQWSAKPITKEALHRYREAKRETGLKRIFAHAGYLINLASNQPEVLHKSRAALLDELERCRLLGLPFIVLHPGAHLGAGEKKGLNRIIDSLHWVLHRFEGKTKIALEVTAGQGTVLGSKIEHLACLIKNSKSGNRLVVCLDTCHLFAAGYDLRKSHDLDTFIRHFRKNLPWRNVVCVHLNDSKGPLGKRLDRHEILGKGKIGWPCFRTIMNHPAFANVALCLETPKGVDNINDRKTLKKLKQFRR